MSALRRIRFWTYLNAFAEYRLGRRPKSLVVLGIWVPLLIFCYGALLHTAAAVVGGSNKPFATTNRMLAYSFGANLQTLAIPFLGPVLFVVFWCVQMCCGLSQTHGKSMGQALGAFLLATLTAAFFIGLMLAMV